MTPLINNPASLGSIVAEVAAIKAVTDLLPNAGALSSVIQQRLAAGGLTPLAETGAYMVALGDGTPAHTYGTEVEIDASAAEDYLVEGFAVDPATGTPHMVVSLSIGGAGSEVIQAEMPVSNVSSNAGPWYFPLPRPFKFAAGQRLTAALRSGGTTGVMDIGVVASKMGSLEPQNG